MKTLHLLAIAGVVSVSALASAADHAPAPVAVVPYIDPVVWEASRMREFGSSASYVTQIPAAAFHPEYSGGRFSYTEMGYFGPDSDSQSGYLWAPVSFPTGVKVCWLKAYVHDVHPSGTVSFYLYRTTGGSSDSPGLELLASGQSSVSSGNSLVAAAVVPTATGTPECHTIRNDASADPDHAGQYFVEIYFDTYSDLSIRGVELTWNRQVAPGPDTATFTDVPTTHTFYKEVEALKASGITSGKTATTYAPDDTVTRGQMAAFLARALGLQWGP